MAERGLARRDFAAEPAEVFALLSDPHATSQAAQAREVSGLSGPVQLGATWQERLKDSEAPPATLEVVAYEPPSHYALRFRQAQLALRFDYYVKARGVGGTRVEAACGVEGPGGCFGWVVATVLGKVLAAQGDHVIGAHLDALAERLGEPGPDGVVS